MTQGAVDKIGILITNNNTDTRESLQKLLASQQNIEIIGVVNIGRGAIDSVKNDHPDVVLIDRNMLEMDGCETTNQITSLAIRKITEQQNTIPSNQLPSFMSNPINQKATS